MAFTARYSAEQKQAIIDACLIYGFTAKRACEAAAKGELPGAPASLAPFEMVRGSASAMVGEARRKQALATSAAAKPEAVMERALVELAARVDRDVMRIARGKRKVSAAEIRDYARAAREVASLAREIHAKRPAQPASPDGDGKNGHEAPDGFVRSLAARS